MLIRTPHLRRNLTPYLFLAPVLFMWALFGLYPLIQSLILSLHATIGPQTDLYVGLRNYAYLLHDPEFYRAVANTFVFAICSILIQLPLSLMLATLLNGRLIRARSWFRLVFFSPNLVGQVFVGIMFAIIFAPQFGLFNRVLHSLLGLALDTKWLGNPALVMPAIVIASLWMYVGGNMIYFLAAMQAIDPTLFDAAHVDGANRFQVFLHITLPSIRHVALFVVVMSTIGSLQLYELPYVLLSGPGPENAGLTIVMYLFNTAFVQGDLGYGSAVGWSLGLIVLLVTLLQIRFTRMLPR